MLHHWPPWAKKKMACKNSSADDFTVLFIFPILDIHRYFIVSQANLYCLSDQMSAFDMSDCVFFINTYLKSTLIVDSTLCYCFNVIIPGLNRIFNKIILYILGLIFFIYTFFILGIDWMVKNGHDIPEKSQLLVYI